MAEEQPNNAQPDFQFEFTPSLKDRLRGKKSNAKRIGINSIFSYGNRSLAITGGKGNRSDLVFNAPNGGRDAAMPMKTGDFMIHHIDDEIEFRGGLRGEELESLLQNPTERVAEDKLKLKGVLEKAFFGHEYPFSNIHIQLIYNILDIQKILGLYINDVIYTINNLQVSEFHRSVIKYDPETINVNEEPDSPYERICYVDDVLGTSMRSEERQRDILYKLRPYLGFFGDAFQIPRRGERNGVLSSEDEYNVKVLKALSALRQWTAHWRFDFSRSYPFFDKNRDGNELLNGVGADWSVVEADYKNKIDRINQSFLNNSKKNVKKLYGILHLYSEAEKRALVQDYYNFSIVKLGKNLGLNLVKLRENIIDKFYPDVKNEICDPHRSKIYTIADYLIYRYLNRHTDVVSQAVMNLQHSANEDQKNYVYQRLAIDIWDRLEDQLEPFFRESCVECPEYVRSGNRAEDEIPPQWIDDVKIKSEAGVPFVMLLSLLCNFLEGKEINELLTAYIHKFENIQSFIDTLTKLGETVQFTQPYSAFNSMNNQYAKEVARQLRILASIGKMKPDLSEAKRPLYIAAIQTLGATDDQVSDEFIQQNILLDRSNQTEYELRRADVNPFRNFIANNVIESRRFLYLVRYSKPKTVRKLMNNAAIVRYTLSRLPEKQIDMYYNRTSGARPNARMDEKLNELTRIVTGLTFQTVMDNRDGIVFDPRRRPAEVERLKAQINLYLTVAYTAIKQLVKINARYYIAYQILERDTELLNKKVQDMGKATDVSKHYIKFDRITNKTFGLIRYFLEQEDNLTQLIGEGKTDDKKAWYAHLNKLKKQRLIAPKWQEIFKREINESLKTSDTGFLPVAVRNMTEHLNVLALIQDYVEQFRKDNSKMKSYFELYHFLMQSMLLQMEEEGLNLERFRDDIKSGIPDGRLIHVTYVPLGYNLARYKNLTTDALFDEDGLEGQRRLARRCYKEAFNRIATAKRRGKSSEAIEAMKNEFVEQFHSEEEANKAVRLGELWGYEDEARQCGLTGKPFPEMVLRMMKFRKFTANEIAQVQHAYDAAKRKSEN